MATILAISSQVARGSVGLSIIVPALHALGHGVIALPTILLSNHPGHGTFAGQRVAPDLLERMIRALATNGWLAGVDMVLSGYLPSPEHAALVARTVDQARQANPSCRYICDPVLGDDPKGLYIEEAAAAAIRDLLLPLADILTPNRFEVEWLSGAPVATAQQAIRAARCLGRDQVIATSIPSSGGRLSTISIGRDRAASCDVDRRAAVPNGTGDLLSALIAGGKNLGAAVAIVDAVIAASAGHDELQLGRSGSGWLEVAAAVEVEHDAAS